MNTTTINTTVLVKTSTASENKYGRNKNGELSLVLTPLAGKLPNKAMFLDGTIAKQFEMESNKMYLIQVTESQSNSYGRQFRVSNLGTVTTMEYAMNAKKFVAELLAPEIFAVEEEAATANISTAETVEETTEETF